MALTRITSGVISANAVSAEKLANGSLTSRVLANTSIELKHLASSANFTGSVNTVQANLTANNIQFTANLNTTSSNIASITTNVNIVSGNVGGVAANTIQNKANVDTALDNVVQIVANVDTVSTNVTNITGDATTNFTVNKTFEQNVTIQGNLIVVGSQVDLGVGTATIDDNFVVVSANLTGTPATDSGIVISRGSEGNVFIGDHIGDEGVVFAITDSPHNNATIAIREYMDVHANAFHAESDMNFSRVHFGHVDDETTGIIVDTTNSHIKFIVSGAEKANLTSGGNLHLADGSIHSGNLNGGNQIDLDDDVFADRQNSIVVRSLQSIGFFLDWNDSETGNFLGVYDAEDDPNNVTKDDALFSVRDTGDVFVDQSINIGTTANVNGVDLVANDYATFTRLNANINVVNQNVDSGVGLVKKVNVITTSGSNVFFVNTPSATQIPTDIEKVNVYVDGVYQHPDDPGTSNNDFVYDSSDASVTFTDPSLPNGLTVIIDALCPRP